jgi:hypothetical protein
VAPLQQPLRKPHESRGIKNEFQLSIENQSDKVSLWKMCKPEFRRTPQNFEIAARAGGRRGHPGPHHIHWGTS